MKRAGADAWCYLGSRVVWDSERGWGMEGRWGLGKHLTNGQRVRGRMQTLADIRRQIRPCSSSDPRTSNT